MEKICCCGSHRLKLIIYINILNNSKLIFPHKKISRQLFDPFFGKINLEYKKVEALVEIIINF